MNKYIISVYNTTSFGKPNKNVVNFYHIGKVKDEIFFNIVSINAQNTFVYSYAKSLIAFYLGSINLYMYIWI
ncbi:hypothetical protein [Plasmodium yoelii yoelii]|uniref:Uncharacterized protein n=1 Tax=Plasmodium yoelii yoelii TaxID=73239 RepID=Q7RBI4_PLAYO|nr:hypothetical protein [Plasmodium yoelii yoelii]